MHLNEFRSMTDLFLAETCTSTAHPARPVQCQIVVSGRTHSSVSRRRKNRPDGPADPPVPRWIIRVAWELRMIVGVFIHTANELENGKHSRRGHFENR